LAGSSFEPNSVIEVLVIDQLVLPMTNLFRPLIALDLSFEASDASLIT
jgi:hypothetical protein